MVSLKKIIHLFSIGMLLVLLISNNLFSNFVENNGQFPENVRFWFQTKDANVWINNNDILFDYINEVGNNSCNRSTLKLSFSEAINFNIQPISYSNRVFNYFTKSNPFSSKVYDTLIVKNLYDKIDLFLYSKNGCFAYDFLLHPGANPNDIKIKVDGADSVKIETKQISFFTTNIVQYHSDLNAYLEESKIPIVSSFSFDGYISFSLNNYDKSQMIRIDPAVYSTYLGGSSFDYLRSIAKDSSGNIIVVGRTRSANYPTIIGSYDTTFSDIFIDFYDAVVTKFSPDGKNILFSTFLGGMGNDQAEAVAVDKFGNIYITGYTLSLRSFPFTSKALDTFDIGGIDGFLTVMNPQGDSLLYSTLFGGTSDDFPQSITLDKNKNIYLAGYTKSSNFITTSGAFDTTFNSNGTDIFNDAFVMKFSSNFNLQYSTYVGGSGDDFGQSIAVDALGNAIVVGITRSQDFPISSFGFQKVIADSVPSSSTGDGFIFKLNSNGTNKIFGTYFGGSALDAIYSVAIDSSNNIYFAGYSESENLPISPNAFQNTYNNINSGYISGDAFVGKLKFSGDSLLFSTYFGGSGSERIAAIAIDSYGFPVATGFTTSRDLPTTPTAFQKQYSDSTDAFVVRFTPNLDGCPYISYLGGKRNDIANSIVTADYANIWVAGFTNSNDFPVTADAIFSTAFDNLSDMFITKLYANYISLDFEKSLGTRIINVCLGDSVYVGAKASGGIGKISYHWLPTDGVSFPDSCYTFIKPNDSSVYYLLAQDEMGNSVTDSLYIIVHTKPHLSLSGSLVVLSNSTEEYTLVSDYQGFTDWYVTNGKILEKTSTKLKVKWADTTAIGVIKLVFTSQYGCIDSLSVSIRIGNIPKPRIKPIGKFPPCNGDTLLLDAGAGYATYLWSTGDTTRTIKITQNGKYSVKVADSLGFVAYSDTINVYFMTYPKPIINGLSIVKPGMNYEYIVEGSPGSNFKWIIQGGTILSGQDNDTITVRWNNTPSGSLLVEETTREGCVIYSDLFEIDISGVFKPRIRVLGSTNICEGDSVLLDAGYGFSYYRWNNGSNKRFIFVSTADTFYCYVRDNYGFEGFTDTITTTTLERPPKPAVRVFGNQFTCLIDSLPIQWYFNDQVIPNAIGTLFIADVPGRYKVCVRGYNGCINCSDIISYLVSVDESKSDIMIFPNPCDNVLNVNLNINSSVYAKISIYNVIFEKVFIQEFSNNSVLHLDVSYLPTGVYLLVIENNLDVQRILFLKN
ncbi:MAG: SBBP repeat-containing protein [Ignavibacteria bacterium]|nr:SBBP repeat-containing protein [Ignavibacteria bacterium]